MFSWFDTKETDAFAQSLVEDLVKRLPPASIGRPDRKTGDRVHRMNEVISARVNDFVSQKKPNLYKRASLGNRVKWQLKEAGYPDDFAATFISELMTLVTVAGRG